MNEKDLEAIIGLVIYGGDGKSNAAEAIRAAKRADFEFKKKVFHRRHRAFLSNFSWLIFGYHLA